jgi:hypothetical protein
MDETQLPHGWIPVSVETAAKLEAELRRELPRSHQLAGRSLRAVARRDNTDDVLFELATGEGPVFCVHLTWSVERKPPWPWTDRYDSITDFVERWPREHQDGAAGDAE